MIDPHQRAGGGGGAPPAPPGPRPTQRILRELAFWRGATAVLALALAALLSWVFFAGPPAAEEPEPPAEERPPRLVLEPVEFGDLPGWTDDDPTAALPALAESCGVLQRRPPERQVGRSGLGGTAADWLAFCDGLAERRGDQSEDLRSFLEGSLVPYRVSNHEEAGSLVTGYYEPTLHGSRKRAPGFQVPLYLRPPELVDVDLGAFRDDLDGRRIAGRLRQGRLVPFPDRSEIESGALADRGLELLWVDDPVDAFFLQIQGSGRVVLPDGSSIRVGYAGQNGHPYFPIGRELVARGALALEEVSMQSIRRWLEEHPEEAVSVLARNASFVFFRELPGEGPLGSLGVPLAAGRSAAIDRRFLPLGAPLWLATTLPASGDEPEPAWRRLLVAQDTGGAIRGPTRIDVYFGSGEAAAEVAGRMRQEGALWLLLPRGLESATREWIASQANPETER